MPNMTKLETVVASNNSFTGTLRTYPTKSFNVSFNNITGGLDGTLMPHTIQVVDVKSNLLTGIISNLPASLKYFDFSVGNKLKGSLVVEEPEYVYGAGNKITEFIIGNSSSLMNCDMSLNPLLGQTLNYNCNFTNIYENSCPLVINLAIGLNYHLVNPNIVQYLKDTNCCDTTQRYKCDSLGRVIDIVWERKGLNGTVNSSSIPSQTFNFFLTGNKLSGNLFDPKQVPRLLVGDNFFNGSIAPVYRAPMWDLRADLNSLSGPLPLITPSSFALVILNINRLSGVMTGYAPFGIDCSNNLFTSFKMYNGYTSSIKLFNNLLRGPFPSGHEGITELNIGSDLGSNRMTGNIILNNPKTININNNFISGLTIKSSSQMTSCSIKNTPLLNVAGIESLNCTKEGLYVKNDCVVVVELAYSLNMHLVKPSVMDQLHQNCCIDEELTGVTCINSNVTRINWDSFGLNGTMTTLPDTLDVFSIEFNSISGSIPTLPTSLTKFYASNNLLTGSIQFPAAVKEYRVSNNKLNGLLTSIPSSLQRLFVSQNNLSGTVLLPSIEFDGSFNKFTRLPSSVPLTLKTLIIHGNSLIDDVPDFSNVENLYLGQTTAMTNKLTGSLVINNPKLLYIQGNFITDIQIANKQSILNCNLDNTPLLGNFNIDGLDCSKKNLYKADDCPEIIKLASTLNMESILLSKMDLINQNCCQSNTGIECINLKTVTGINWENLGLFGSMSTAQLPLLLKTLNLANNSITGVLPSISSALESLSIEENYFQGFLPPYESNLDFNNMDNLKSIIVYGNNMSGPVPYYPSLETLWISDENNTSNHFSGPLTLNAPKSIRVANNLIISIEILNNTNLEDCQLQYNPLENFQMENCNTTGNYTLFMPTSKLSSTTKPTVIKLVRQTAKISIQQSTIQATVTTSTLTSDLETTAYSITPSSNSTLVVYLNTVDGKQQELFLDFLKLLRFFISFVITIFLIEQLIKRVRKPKIRASVHSTY